MNERIPTDVTSDRFLCERYPADIISDFHFVTRAGNREEVVDLTFEIIHDVMDSVALAMKGAGLTDAVNREVRQTVYDYITNHYGDL